MESIKQKIFDYIDSQKDEMILHPVRAYIIPQR